MEENIMKNSKKRIVRLLLAAFALISVFGAAMTVNAAAPKLTSKKIVCYMGNSSYAQLPIKGLSKATEVVSNKYGSVKAQYSNPDIAELRTSGYDIEIEPKNPGSTDVTFEVKYGKGMKKTKKLTCNIEVREYENPCKQLKFGSKDYASKFKKTAYTFFVLKGKQKLSVKAADGWKLTGIVAHWMQGSGPNKVKSVKIKNGQVVDHNHYFQVDLIFKNKQTKGEIRFFV